MLTAIGIIVFIFFGRLSLLEQPQLRLALTSRRWHPVMGAVTCTKDNSFMVNLASGYASGHKEDLLTIQYEVSGFSFTTQSYSFGGHLDQPFGIHRVGDHLAVYYNPSNPAQAVVKRGVTFSLLLSPILCLSGLGWVVWLTVHSCEP